MTFRIVADNPQIVKNLMNLFSQLIKIVVETNQEAAEAYQILRFYDKFVAKAESVYDPEYLAKMIKEKNQISFVEKAIEASDKLANISAQVEKVFTALEPMLIKRNRALHALYDYEEKLFDDPKSKLTKREKAMFKQLFDEVEELQHNFEGSGKLISKVLSVRG